MKKNIAAITINSDKEDQKKDNSMKSKQLKLQLDLSESSNDQLESHRQKSNLMLRASQLNSQRSR